MKQVIGWTALALATLASPVAHAGGFTPWGTATGDKTVVFDPYFFVDPDGTFRVSPYVWVGATDHFDVLFGATAAFGSGVGPAGASLGALEVMPRGIINDYAIFGFHVFWTPLDDSGNLNESVDLALEYHGVAAYEHFAFTYNAGWAFTVGNAGFDAGGVFGVLVPEYIINDRISAFVEVNPSVTINAGDLDGDGEDDVGWGVGVNPGVTVYLDNNGMHSLTPAALFSVAGTDTSVGFGLLYWGAFETGGKTARRRTTGSDTKLALR
ncbi:MAG: hypothetical protein H6732_15775 [Alphaproteobacteria bacterium]|nr:hypothetical protein [Alphaproteobacteria bacterium]